MTARRVVAALACVAMGLGLSGFVGTASAATPPSNDTISGATVVSALPFTDTVDTTGATTDADDAQANQDCGAPATNNSVWYKFTAGTKDRFLAVDTTGSTFSSGVIIATGTPGALSTQACGPVSAESAVSPGKTYYILVFDDTGSGGTLHVSMHGPGPVPANDKIAHAARISTLPFRATLDTTGATTDAVDAQANASCGAPVTNNSVWYTFTAGRNHHNIFVDASQSDYSAGVLIATGSPGALTTVACAPAFVTTTTTPGTTYHIMIFDDSDAAGGTLRLHVGDAPDLALNVDKTAHIDTHGVVGLTGAYTCTRATTLHISGSLIEIVGNKIVSTGRFDTLGIPSPNCDGSQHSWTGLVLADTTSFAPGQAAVFINASACGQIACTLISQTTVVKIVKGVAATSGIAPNESLHTRTIHRPSRRRYGNALHAPTAAWSH